MMQNYSTKHPLSSFCVLFGFNSTTNTQFTWKIYTHTHKHTHTHTYTHSSFILIIHWYIKYYRSNRQLFVSWYYMSHNNNLFTQQKWITLNFDWAFLLWMIMWVVVDIMLLLWVSVTYPSLHHSILTATVCMRCTLCHVTEHQAI
jgi:hypothetical protein